MNDQNNLTSKELLDDLLSRRDELKPKDRRAIPLQDMPQQDPIERGKNFSEVALGYTMEQARIEALRCLECKTAPCVDNCPVRIDIPGFVGAVADGDFEKAIRIVKTTSLLPAICGRVCPQETQCQATCTIGKIFKDPEQSVSIGRLERFVADWEREKATYVEAHEMLAYAHWANGDTAAARRQFERIAEIAPDLRPGIARIIRRLAGEGSGR